MFTACFRYLIHPTWNWNSSCKCLQRWGAYSQFSIQDKCYSKWSRLCWQGEGVRWWSH